MTEDEAFIRAVVDSPGDDTPRLVYADWLDDRGDPRGAYLRAEHEWAKPWRSGGRPAVSPELRELAAGLDPVWAARVSRPPVGVCLDRSSFRRDTEPATDDAVDRVADRFGVVFPPEYRAFLLNYNGGAVYDDPPGPDMEAILDCGFHSVEEVTEFAEEIFARGHGSNRHCGLFPIGALDVGRAGYLLGVGPAGGREKLYGRVFACYGHRGPWTRDGGFVEVENWDSLAADSLPLLFAGFMRSVLFTTPAARVDPSRTDVPSETTDE